MRAAFFAVLSVLATACAGSKDASEDRPAYPVASVAAASAQPEVTTVAASSSSGTIVLRTITVEAAGDPIGLPECDEYVRLVRICYTDQPELQAAFLDGVRAWKEQASEGGARREALLVQCRKILDVFPREVCGRSP